MGAFVVRWHTLYMIGVEDILLQKLSYLGLFFFLAGSSVVVPVPEEILLLTAGHLTALGYMVPIKAIPLAIIALLLGDSILFFLARTGSRYITGIHERFVRMNLDRTWVFSPDHPLRAVFIMRFVTGLRMIAPIYAGLNRASWKGFLLTDFVALCIFVPIVYFLGFRNSDNFLIFVAAFEIARHVLFWTAVAVLGGGFFAATHTRLRKFFKNEPAEHHHHD